MQAAATVPIPPVVEAKNDGKGTTINSGYEDEMRWRPFLDLPCQLTVEVPIPKFRVADFLALRTGSVVTTSWRVTHDVPLRVNGTPIAWAELEGASKLLAVRLTELA